MSFLSPEAYANLLEKIKENPMNTQGRFSYNVPMSQQTWLQVGGPLGCLFTPQNWQDLQIFLQFINNLNPQSTQKHREDMLNMISSGGKPLALGAGSNVLVRDGGMPQDILVKFGRGFHQIAFFPPNHCPIAEDLHLMDHDHSKNSLPSNLTSNVLVYFGAGLLDRFVAQFCQSKGLSGLEFLYTIPGTIGGGLFMNAGCFGHDFSTCLVGALVMDPQGKVHYKSKKDLHYGYRSCSLVPGWFFLGGYFFLQCKDPLEIAVTMDNAIEQRNETQPTHVKTGGSTFGNPPGYSAWRLIDQEGFRGKTRGHASFSSKHCNFLINEGGASAQDLEFLGQEAQDAVLRNKNQWLEWEIVRWGKPRIVS